MAHDKKAGEPWDRHNREAVKDRVETYMDHAGKDRKEVKQQAKEARHEVREQSKDFIDALDSKVEAVKDGAWTYTYHANNQEHEVKERAREIRREIREETKRAEKQIESRADHFGNGLEQIENDLKYISSGNDAEGGNRTSSMQPDGDYIAKDDYGTENNYEDRLELHTAATLERIEEEVTDAAEKMRAKVEQLHPRN